MWPKNTSSDCRTIISWRILWRYIPHHPPPPKLQRMWLHSTSVCKNMARASMETNRRGAQKEKIQKFWYLALLVGIRLWTVRQNANRNKNLTVAFLVTTFLWVILWFPRFSVIVYEGLFDDDPEIVKYFEGQAHYGHSVCTSSFERNNEFQVWMYMYLYIPLQFVPTGSKSNGYLARFWKILPNSCKNMHIIARFLPGSCNITIFLPGLAI